MEIRKIKPEERVEASKIQAIAFMMSQDFSAVENDPQKSQGGYETGRAVFNDEGKMCSCFELIPYNLRFDGHIVKMAGIGGVASLPEQRRKGNVRSLFHYCFEEMRENSQLFSYLYPFSHPYYRKFGYELGAYKIKTSIPFTSFSHFQQTGSVRLFTPGEGECDIRLIYSTFSENKNLTIVREDKLWNNLLIKDPYKTKQYTYIWYNNENQPRAYIVFNPNSKGEYSADMGVKELIWLDEEALTGILGFVGQLASKFENFIWEAPDFVNLRYLFPEPYNVSQTIQTSGMNRIVDVQKVLQLMSYPEAPGKVILGITDDFLDWNNSTFDVSWDSQKVEVMKTEQPADMTCSVQSLSQLVTGLATIEDLTFRRDIKINSNHNLISNVFRKKHLYINDYF